MKAINRLFSAYAGLGIHHKHLMNNEILHDAGIEIEDVEAMIAAAREMLADLLPPQIIYIGYSHKQYGAIYGSDVINPVEKLAAALERLK